MPEARRFCRFRSDADAGRGTIPLPNDGFCLSAFVLVRPVSDPTKVLVGQVGRSGDWGRVGGIDPARLERIGADWMLPASHLLLFESPDEAARRIAREQLGGEVPGMMGPLVVSDPYRREGGASLDPHWDIHFIYEGTLPAAPRAPEGLWDRLAFIDPGRAPPPAFARGHGDILEFARAARSRPVSGGRGEARPA
ncbi:MAG TPA: NUDIX hydrolase [Thermoplasmata archaeon]|nr:NUDIX hydrolase [Thermoplasmata archaeon]